MHLGFDESHRESTRKRDRPSSFPQIEEYVLGLFESTEKQGTFHFTLGLL